MTRPASQTLAGAAIALGLHGALLAYLFLGVPPRPSAPPRAPPRAPTRVRIASAPPPRPEPVAVSAPVQATAALPAEAPKRKLPPRKQPALAETPKPTAQAEPAPAEPAAPAAAPKPRRFAVALEATVGSGGVAVPTTGAATSWGFGDASGALGGDDVLLADSGAVASEATGVPSRAVDAAQLTTWPKLVSQPSTVEMRAAYPEAARREPLEANVGLKLLVSATGEVLDVRLLSPAGNGFDEAALGLVKRLRFEPGRRSGQPVAVWIPWTYKFRLDG